MSKAFQALSKSEKRIQNLINYPVGDPQEIMEVQLYIEEKKSAADFEIKRIANHIKNLAE